MNDVIIIIIIIVIARLIALGSASTNVRPSHAPTSLSNTQSVMLNEDTISRPRPRPRPISQVEAKAMAKNKAMNKKYQMMIGNMQLNLYRPNFITKTTHFNFSFSLTQ